MPVMAAESTDSLSADPVGSGGTCYSILLTMVGEIQMYQSIQYMLHKLSGKNL